MALTSTIISIARKYLSRRHQVQGFVFIWKLISYYAANNLVKDTENEAFSKCCMLMQAYLVLFSVIKHREKFTFQPDNRANHRSAYKNKRLGDKYIYFMKCPSCSPDLNPIENLRFILARRIYYNGSQFYSVNGLWECLTEIWYFIP